MMTDRLEAHILFGYDEIQLWVGADSQRDGRG